MEADHYHVEQQKAMDGWSAASVAGILLALLMFLGLAASMYLFTRWTLGPPVDEQALRQQKLKELVTSQKQQLENYGWVNKQEGVAHIPIDVAMKKLIDKPPAPRANQPVNPAPAAPAGSAESPAPEKSDPKAETKETAPAKSEKPASEGNQPPAKEGTKQPPAKAEEGTKQPPAKAEEAKQPPAK